MTSPLEQAQYLKEGCKECIRNLCECGHKESFHFRKKNSSILMNLKRRADGDYEYECDVVGCNCGKFIKSNKIIYCEKCKAKAQTLLENCEWIQGNIDMTFSLKVTNELKETISICKEILQ